MPDSFFNNQEVTAEDLNNIAIDLGFADYSHFPENPPQSAVSALNQITADLTSEGILQIGNKCAVSIEGNTIIVQDGVCVFANGAKKRIENAISVEFIEGGTNYVYLFNDIAGNKIELVDSLTEPISGDFVMLAMITQNRIVYDKRGLSVSKVGAGSNLVTNFSVNIPKGVYPDIGDVVFSLEVPPRYSRIIFDYFTIDSGTERFYSGAILRLKDMVFEVQYTAGTKDTSAYTHLNYWDFNVHRLRAERAGDFVNFICTRDNNWGYREYKLYGKFV